MGRNATISIFNDTQAAFNYSTDDVAHGKFNQNPPSTINAQKTGVFEVGNRDGAKVGPQGSVTYSTSQNGDTFNVIFTWNHPFGPQTSSYTCASDPQGKITASLTPANPSGHDQSVSWLVELAAN